MFELISKKKPVLPVLAGLLASLTVGCATTSSTLPDQGANTNRDADSLLIVDCLLPGQVRQLGTRLTYLSPRRPIKATAATCQIRGGEYVAYDRASFSTALKIWLPRAQEGDPEAQTYVGEIYEKGLGLDSDYQAAAQWYQKAAEQNFARAKINLGYLYEAGLGVDKDLTTAMNFYRDASGITDGELEYVSSIEFANRVEAKEETAKLKTQVAQLSQELAESESRYQAEQRSLSDQQQELVALEKEIETQKQRVLAETQTAQAESDQTAAYLKQIDVLKNQVSLAKTEEGNLRTALKSRQAETNKLRKQYAEAFRELDLANRQLEEKQNNIATLETQLSVAGSEQTAEQAQLTQAQQEVQQLQARVQALQSERSESDSELLQASQQLEFKQATITELQGRLAAAESDQSQGQAELVKARQEVQILQARVDSLKSERSSSDLALEQQVAEAHGRELALSRQIDEQADIIAQMESQQGEVEGKYRKSIELLQEQLIAGRGEQERLTGKLSAANVANEAQQAENQALRASLEKQTQAVAERELEQKRLTEKYAQLQISTRATISEKKELRASLSRADNELAAAKLEQSRLTNRLLNQQLSAKQEKEQAAFDLAVLEGKLSEREAAIRLQNERLASLESVVARTRAQLNESPREQVAQVVANGPMIDIINPPVLATRGAPALPAQRGGTLELIGKVNPADNLLAFNINGQAQSLNEAGVFKFRTNSNVDSLELVAVDQDGFDTRLKLLVDKGSAAAPRPAAQSSATSEPAPVRGIEFGKYYALVVGNNQYSSLSNLNTAENDARTIDRLLREKYGFHTELLLNATRVEFLTALNRLRENLTPKDNLLVYYAGHGELDQATQRGYWLPVDADASDTESWISNSAVTDFLDTMAAKHILVIADSCYSGTMTRSSLARRQPDMTAEVRAKWLKAISRSKVRAVLSSGGVKPVYDGTANAEHSLFAEVFIDELQNAGSIIEGYSLFFNLQQRVNAAANRLGVDQNPQYSPIKHAGHEAGEFLFVPSALKL